MRSMNLHLARLERQRAVALVERSSASAPGSLRDHLVEDVVLVHRDHAEPPAGAAEVLANRNRPRWCCAAAHPAATGNPRRTCRRRRRSAASGRVAWSSRGCRSCAIVSLLSAMPVGLPGLTTKNALIFGSSSFLSSASLYWKRFSCGACDVHHLEVVVLEVRHLEIGREDRRAERDRVAGHQQPVGLQRLEDVAHRRRAALDRVEVELARWAAARRTSPTSDTRARSARCGPACDQAPDSCRR